MEQNKNDLEYIFTNTYETYCKSKDYSKAYVELIYKPLFGKFIPKYRLTNEQLIKRKKAMMQIINYFKMDRFTYTQVLKLMYKTKNTF